LYEEAFTDGIDLLLHANNHPLRFYYNVMMNMESEDTEQIDMGHVGDAVRGKIGPGRGDFEEAEAAAELERQNKFLQSLKLYPAAIGWSALLSAAIIMEGYDMKLIGSLNAQPAFSKRYGEQIADGSYEIPAAWQAGLANGATIGSLVGLYLNGHLSERLGFRKTMIWSLALMICTIFIPFFAPSVGVLLVGQVCQGIPWGVFQTLTATYAAEVCPTHLRGHLTTYVNLCWVGIDNTSGHGRIVVNKT
jgi:SP family general alpha glucoside:H+ symporter-like MFS transporter